MKLALPYALKTILERAPELNRAFLVGGCVRDWVLGSECKDLDVEVYGQSMESLRAGLEKWGRVDSVGKSFGVLKVRLKDGVLYDFSLPRTDSKCGEGHRGFEVRFDPDLSMRQAAARRDFTINGLMYDPRTDELIDFFGGQSDLKAKVLRCIGQSFSEDPLRVLRGMQLAARFDLTACPKTIALCRGIKHSFRELAPERVFEEWRKWSQKSVRPSRGLSFLRETEWIEFFPELESLQGVPQDPEWHPEGDVWRHTLHCCDALATLPEWKQADENTKSVLSFAVLAHDFGKPKATQATDIDGKRRIISPGHDIEGGPLADAFLQRIQAPRWLRERVVPLVRHHMAHLNVPTQRSVRRLAQRLNPETIDRLYCVMRADAMGRPPKPGTPSRRLLEFMNQARELKVQSSAPAPLLTGKALLELGIPPGKAMGALLRKAFEAQLDGEFHDPEGALRWARKNESKLTEAASGSGNENPA